MLKSLIVRNYALIRELSIQFHHGFSIITGETGAGKSILMDAFSLILGERADSSMIYNGAEKCVVEAVFEISEYDLQWFFENHDIDYANETLIRREVYANGKSRAFINDIPANLAQLKELCVNLVDIHSQHQNLQLSDFLFQLKTIDSVAGTKTLLTEYKQQYKKYRELLKEFDEITEKAAKSKADADYFSFQYNQLDTARLKEEEQEEIESELGILNHAEEIKVNLSHASELLNADSISVLSNLKEMITSLSKIASYCEAVKDILKRTEAAYIELKDVLRDIEVQSEKTEYDPDRIKILSERLDLLYSLQQKHRVTSTAELIQLRDEFRQKLDEIESFDLKIEKLEKEKNGAFKTLENLAKSLTEKRLRVIPKIESEIIGLLQQLGMPNAQFKIMHRKLEELNMYGNDEVTFMFSANRNIAMQELSKIASGGEISRLMLSLKYIISMNLSLPTLVLDEIDTGVSGEIAGKMAGIMHGMSQHMQVINITHLPQIASKGQYHYKVFKTEMEKSTVTDIKLLTDEERITEIAKMLSGEQLSEAAILNARELLTN